MKNITQDQVDVLVTPYMLDINDGDTRRAIGEDLVLLFERPLTFKDVSTAEHIDRGGFSFELSDGMVTRTVRFRA